MISLDPAPAFLCAHPELVEHCLHGAPAHTALGLVCPVTNFGKGRLNGIRRPDMHLVHGREVIEGQQGLTVLFQAGHGLRVLGRVCLHKMVKSLLGRDLVPGHPDFLQGILRLGLNGLGQVVQYVRCLRLWHPASPYLLHTWSRVHPAALMTGLGIHFIQRCQET